MNKEIFKNIQDYKILRECVYDKLRGIDDQVVQYRGEAEIANSILSILPQLKRTNCSISKEIIDVVTHDCSKFYFPELTHLNIQEYDQQYKRFYNEVISIMNVEEQPVSILDLGCGICDIAIFIMDNISVSNYYAVDKNQDVIFVNQLIYKEYPIIYLYQDILSYSVASCIDYVLLFNVLKHVEKKNRLILLKNIVKSNQKIKILICDIEPVLEEIEKTMLEVTCTRSPSHNILKVEI